MSTRSAKVAPVNAPQPDVSAVPHRSQTRRRPRRARLVLLYGLLAIVLAAGITFGVQTIAFYAHHATTDDAQIEGHIDPVLPRVAGYVAEVLVHENDSVTAGQALVRIDPRDFESRVHMAQTALASAQATVAVAKANAVAADTRRLKAARDLERSVALRKQQVVSQEAYDGAKADADATAADHETALRRVAAAEAMVAQKQADLDYAKLQLSYTTISAPVSGFVSKKSVEVGQFIEAGQPLLAVVADRDVWVVANFKETQLHRMRAGQAATVEVDAYPGATFHARIDSIAAATGAKFALLPPDNATGNFVKVVQRIPVKLVFTDPADAARPLRVGMNVTAIVDLG